MSALPHKVTLKVPNETINLIGILSLLAVLEGSMLQSTHPCVSILFPLSKMRQSH